MDAYIYMLAMEPQGNHINSRRLPALCLNYDFSYFLIKVDLLNLESQNQAKNIPKPNF